MVSRLVSESIDYLARRAGQVRWILSRAAQIFANEGAASGSRRIREKIYRLLKGERVLSFRSKSVNKQYQIWRRQRRLTPDVVLQMRRESTLLGHQPLVTVVVTVRNAHQGLLEKAVESIRRQIYTNWEMWLTGASSMSAATKSVIDQYVSFDRRIHNGIADANVDPIAQGTGLPYISGEFVWFLGQHDELAPNALLEAVRQINERPDLDLLYSDEDIINTQEQHIEPFFKPDWSPNLLLSMNYLSHSCVFRRSLLLSTMRCGTDFQELNAYDLVLRFTEKTKNIGHIPQVLYHSRPFPLPENLGEVHDQVPVSHDQMALENALQRQGEKGHIQEIQPGRFRIRYELRGRPLVSIIIPTRDRFQLLEQCVSSIETKTQYAQYEIVVIDNDSDLPEMRHYLERLARKWRVCRYTGAFNFSAINNYGVAQADGEYLLFLNDDTEVIEPHWLTAMIGQVQRNGVGVVGAKLLYPDESIQHAGVVLGICGGAGHAFRYSPHTDWGYHGFAQLVRDCSAVTAACMLTPRAIFEKVHGFNVHLPMEYNDVDFCLRVSQAGKRIVYTPEALLYHYESSTRRGARSHPDERLFKELWADQLKSGDPYYNPNLTLSREDWSLRIK